MLAALSAGMLLVGLATVLPLYFGATNSRSETSAPFEVMVWNVSEYNRDFRRFAAYVKEHPADLIVLTEVPDDWIKGLTELSPEYHVANPGPKRPRFNLAVLSRSPVDFVSADELPDSQTGPPPWRVRFDVEGRPLTLITSHPVSPTLKGHYSFRYDQYRDLVRAARLETGAVMIAGDLNGTSWSPHFQDLVRDSGLTDSRRGYGIQATFPSYVPFVRVPIDHCLVSSSIVVLDRQVGPDLGSDHLPVLLSLALVRHDVDEAKMDSPQRHKPKL